MKNLLIGLMLIPSFAGAQVVKSGLDVLKAEDFRRIEGKRVGLITNHTSLDASGVNAVDAIYRSGKAKLAAIFSPEHGFRGIEEGGVYIGNSTDTLTGAPVFSLYGKNKQRPTPESLAGLDLLIFDIQDIGARFYTYLTTMGYAMEEAARAGLPFMVLDRPNPVGGVQVEGPLLAESVRAFTAYFPVPVRHGLTAGEMALLHKDDKKLDLKLEVVKAEGWTRDMTFERTAMVWTNPSPNIRSVEAELLYPGIGCFEATNVSVGRGTDKPFEWFGAPWLDGKALAKKLSKAGIKGVRFSYSEKTPDKDVYAGRKCPGVAMEITDRDALRSLEIFTHAVYWMTRKHGKDFVLKEDDIRRMTGSDLFRNMIQGGSKPAEIIKAFDREADAFAGARKKYLLY